ncbi:MAG TPA: hypothetical protein VN367_10905 [Chlorobaculum sp.]|nr:hypothetical protein [Chlorobaculum sp.]
MNLRQTRLRDLLATIVLLLSLLVAVTFVLRQEQSTTDTRSHRTVGHDGSPLLAFLYAAIQLPEGQQVIEARKFGSSADVGYALLSGSIDTGFIQPEKLVELSRLKGFEKLQVLGKVTFPYGATLITKKGSTFRLNEINGRSIAAPVDNTRLLNEFINDVKKYSIDLGKVDFVLLSQDAIIPALESGKIDGAVIKGSRAVIAQQAGHNILYQKWDMQPGNECCPPVIDQLEYVLLGRKDAAASNAELTAVLVKSSHFAGTVLRTAVSKAVHMSENILLELPLSSFEPTDNDLMAVLLAHSGSAHRVKNASSNISDGSPRHIHDASCNHGEAGIKPSGFFACSRDAVSSFFRALFTR